MIMALEDSLELITALIDAECQEHRSEGKLWARSVLDIERFLMKDIDHQIVGRRLAERWEIPDSIRQVIGFHHDIQERSPDLIKLIALANLAASTLFPYPATQTQHPFPILFGKIEQAVNKKGAVNISETVAEVLTQDVFEDLVDVLTRLDIPTHIWEIVDFRTFFHVCYMVSDQIKSTAIGFLQQTNSA